MPPQVNGSSIHSQSGRIYAYVVIDEGQHNSGIREVRGDEPTWLQKLTGIVAQRRLGRLEDEQFRII